MTIFGTAARTSLASRRNTEPDFAYLDRSARPSMQRVREVLEDWMTRYPSVEVPELVARICSGNNQAFASATFELYLHELLLRLGCTLAVHPDLPNGETKHPDFLVTPPCEDPFYLEAIVASGNSTEDDKADNRLAAVLDALHGMSGSNFYLSLSEVAAPPQSAKTSKMVSEVQAWLVTLDADAVEQQLESDANATAPSHVYQEGEWKLHFEAYPKSKERRSDPDSPNIGMVTTVVEDFEPWKTIQKAVHKKASRYGTLDRPFLVAINVGSFHIDIRDIMDGLFGQEQLLVIGESVEARRMPNGAWHGPNGPQAKRVSGILVLRTWSIFRAGLSEAYLFHHPWGQRPLGVYLDRLPHARVEGDEMKPHDGLHPGDVIGLNQDWPGDD